MFTHVSDLTHGLQGTVSLYRDAASDTHVVMKTPAHLSGENLVLEETVYKRLGAHHNIVNFIGTVRGPRHNALVLEYYPNGDLFQLLERQEKRTKALRLPECIVATVARDVARALAHCQSRGVSHLDIKPENIFAAQNRFLLGDFGLSAIHAPNKSEICTSYRGTPIYMCPELRVSGKVSRANVKITGELADVWSLGICCFGLLAGTMPFYSLSKDDRLFQIR